MRKLVVLTALIVGLVAVPSANATISNVFGTDLSCSVLSGNGNIRYCGVQPNSNPAGAFSTTPTWDGSPIDVSVAFPPDPGAGDANWPLVMLFHGYGGQKLGLSSMQRWLDQGYAVMVMTDRGFGKSCGSQQARAAEGAIACANGYNHLQDSRYEVRDAQFLASELAGEGVIDPTKIGANGGSYGGGKSMALAALKNRIMLPDGTLAPWKVPATAANHAGDTISLAAAAPEIPWTDLSYSLVPSGSTLDYVTDNVYNGRVGIQKQSFVAGLYASGCSAFSFGAAGNTFCSNTDPQANLQAWKTRLDAGEPYDGDPTVQTILTEIQQHHSSYYIDHSTAPAPLLISNGWTDDLFPADEALRFYNRSRAQYPSNPISLMFFDWGHMRGANKAADVAKLQARETEWFAKYVKGNPGPTPFQGVETLTQTCPAAAASAGPYYAPNWEAIHPGEVRMTSDPAQTIAPTAGDPLISNTFDPVVGGGNGCAKASGADQAGTATYRLPAAPAGGYTLMGSPTVIADITNPGASSEIAARLLDVGPDGQENLVARGLWRPAVSTSADTQVFQLHPNGYKFEQGHIAKLELLPKDAPYGQASTDQQPVTVANMEIRLPVVDQPGSASGMVQAPLPHFFPGDKRPNPPVTTSGRGKVAAGALKVTKKKVIVKVSCPSEVTSCPGGKVTVQGAPKKGKAGRFVLSKGSFSATGGQTKSVALNLTNAAKKYFKTHRSLRSRVTVTNTGVSGSSKVIRNAKKGG